MKITNENLKQDSLNGLAQKVNEETNRLLTILIDKNSKNSSTRVAPLAVAGVVIAAAGVLSATGIGIAGLLNKPKDQLGGNKTRKLQFTANSKKWCLVRVTTPPTEASLQH